MMFEYKRLKTAQRCYECPYVHLSKKLNEINQVYNEIVFFKD